MTSWEKYSIPTQPQFRLGSTWHDIATITAFPIDSVMEMAIAKLKALGALDTTQSLWTLARTKEHEG